MSTSNILLGLVGVIFICILVGGYFTLRSIRDESVKLKNELIQSKKLAEDLVRSSNKWATSYDVKKSLKNLMTSSDLKSVRDDLVRLDSSMSAIGRTVGLVSKKVMSSQSSDSSGDERDPVKVCEESGDPIDVHGYTKKAQRKELEDLNSAPVAMVEFDASSGKPWTYEIYGRKYSLVTVAGVRDSGQLTFHHKLQYSIPSISTELYPINIASSEYIQVEPKSRFFWINPHIDVNIVVGGTVYNAIGDGSDSILSTGLELGLSMSSYGRNKIDSWFRMFRFGVGYNIAGHSAFVSFSPISFNMGKPMPLINNLYITPHVAMDTYGGVIIGVGIGPQI